MNKQDTQKKLDKIKSALADGVLEVQYDDRKIRYRSLDDMFRIKAMLEDDLNEFPQHKVTKVICNKGL